MLGKVYGLCWGVGVYASRSSVGLDAVGECVLCGMFSPGSFGSCFFFDMYIPSSRDVRSFGIWGSSYCLDGKIYVVKIAPSFSF